MFYYDLCFKSNNVHSKLFQKKAYSHRTKMEINRKNTTQSARLPTPQDMLFFIGFVPNNIDLTQINVKL